MFYNNHRHSGHVWLYLLSFLGAFLLGKEFERMRIRKLAHIHSHHHMHDEIDCGCGCFDEDETIIANDEQAEAINPS